jgi:phosphoenolpyruvate-protein kinase (PTS system EI component)
MKLRLQRVVPLLVLLPPLLLGFGRGVPACAQERRGPTTLENLLQEHAEVTSHGTVARPHHGSTDPVIAAAWKQYDGAIRAASASLLKRIDQNLRRAKSTTDADATTGLQAAKKAFVEQGSLPSMLDAGLRNARRDAETAYRDAALALRQQYDTTTAKLRKTGDSEEAEALVQEWILLQNALELAKDPQFDSTWKHSINNGPSAEIALYSNGSINAPDGPDTWTLKGTTLVIRWQNPEAPGGAWVDTCEVSPHAGSYSGTNQLGTRISGTRVQ